MIFDFRRTSKITFRDTIEINTIEELVHLVKTEGEIVIEESIYPMDGPEFIIEIQDAYWIQRG